MKDTGTPKSKEAGNNSRLEHMAWALLIAFVVFMAIAIIQAQSKAKPPAESETTKRSANTTGPPSTISQLL